MQDKKLTNDNFSRILLTIMKEKKMTQAQLSKKTGLSKVAIFNYLKKERMPGGHELLLLSEALNVSIDCLLGKKDNNRELIKSVAVVKESVDSYDSGNPETEQTEDEAEKARLAEAAEIQKKSDDLLSMFRSMVPMMDTNKLLEIGETCKSLPMAEIIIKELRKRIPRDPQK